MSLGNPVAIMATKGIIGTVKNALSNKTVRVVLIVVVLVFLFKKTIQGAIRKYRESKFDSRSSQLPNKLALSIRSAVNPSGIDWMVDFDTTKPTELLALGQRIKDLGIVKEVSDAYKLKFDETLEERVSKELDSTDLITWEQIIS